MKKCTQKDRYDMRVLVTGSEGQLGYDVIKLLEMGNIACKGVDKKDFDLLDEAAVKAFVKEYKPDVVVHCAAYTAVDNAEDEKEVCHAVNAVGTKFIAEACRLNDAKMMYISTDYVFPGNGSDPYEVSDITGPSNYYGLSKWQGEEAVRNTLDGHFILRISWVFGKNGHNFVKTMLKLSETRTELGVVADQIGSPSYTVDLAELILEMIKTDKFGTYHASNEGYCSWYDFACEIFSLSEKSVKVNPIGSDEFPSKVKRPLNSRLSKESLDRAGFKRLPRWENALSRYIEELKATD